MQKSHEPNLSFEDAVRAAGELRRLVAEGIFGQESLIDEVMACLIAGGHILMTGAPGLAKTTLVRVFARHLGIKFGRIQFTPDLLPSDIVGSDILNIDPASGQRGFAFTPGPIFTNLLLADEINRASPRTQSALLEAMQERTCTVGGVGHQLPRPFMVLATQNPFESDGTFPLPEAQLDRFLLHTLVDYPSDDAEEKILKQHVAGTLVGEQINSPQESKSQLDESTVRGLIQRCISIHVDEEIVRAIKELVRSTRPNDPSSPEDLRSSIWYGAGPRAGLSLVSVAKAMALIQGHETVRWKHVRSLVKPVLRHRIRLTASALRDRLTEDRLIEELTARLEATHRNLARGIG
jgi:MoxR-like ATPase